MLLLYLSLVASDSDAEFVTILYHKLNKRLLGYAHHLSGDVQWAQDATQQVFLIVMGKIEILSQKTDDETSAYCFTIIKRMFYRRCEQQSKVISLNAQEFEPADKVNESTEDFVLKQFEYAKVKAAVQKLSDQHRMIITLRFGLMLTHEEIAQEMEISISYSQNLLAKAVRQLRKRRYAGTVLTFLLIVCTFAWLTSLSRCINHCSLGLF